MTGTATVLITGTVLFVVGLGVGAAGMGWYMTAQGCAKYGKKRYAGYAPQIPDNIVRPTGGNTQVDPDNSI